MHTAPDNRPMVDPLPRLGDRSPTIATPLEEWHPPPLPDDEPHSRPSHNLAAEQGLLGALLLAPELAASLADQLDGADFYKPAHETIWQAIHKVDAGGRLADPALVLEQLQATGDLIRAGGADYLHTCIDACSSPYQADAYAKAVLDHARWRTYDQGLRKLRQILDTATPDTIDDALPNFLDTFDREVIRQGAHTTTRDTGRRDLTWVLDGKPPVVPPPVYGQRGDGTALFYTSRVNGIYGDPEAAKSWIAQWCVVEALKTGSAAIIDVDHNGQTLTVERLMLLGATPSQLGDETKFRYFEPDDGDELKAAITELVAWQPQIAVLDSIGEMLPMLGAGSESNDEITVALRTIAKPLADAGAAVITIDHLPKNKDARTSGYAIGGTAKKRAMDGALIHAETRLAPAPGQVGKIHLRIEKDRPGRLRETCNGKWIGTFTLDSTKPHMTRAFVEQSSMPTNDAGDQRPTHLMEEVSRYLEKAGEARSGKQITDSIKGRPTIIREAIARLIEEGYITTMPGRHSAVLHQLTAVYREADDDA